MPRSQIIPINDGDESIRVRLTETYRNEFSAVDESLGDGSPTGWGDTEMSAISDLLSK